MTRHLITLLGLSLSLFSAGGAFAQGTPSISKSLDETGKQISEEAGTLEKGVTGSKKDMTRMKDLTRACAKECPNAKTAKDIESCLEKAEATHGEAAFKKSHQTCYNAHESYEKAIGGKEEAGTVEESKEGFEKSEASESES